MKKVNSLKHKNIDLIILKYVFLLYTIFLALLLRSDAFKIIAILIYLSFFLITFKIRGGIKKGFLSIYTEVKIIVTRTISTLNKVKTALDMRFFRRYKSEIIIILFYILTMLSVVKWGLPSSSHPFPYFMDESHSLQAVKTVVKNGTSNLPHQEVGPMLNYILSAVLVSPLFVLKIVNPSEITTAISALVVQAQLYTALRIITFMFGVGALISLIPISKILKLKSTFSVGLFATAPVFLLISNYFKYDVALLFWITLSLLLYFNYKVKPTLNNFIFASIVSGFAVSTKLTGAPLLILLFYTFFFFTPSRKKKISHLIIGIAAYVITFVLCGVPDIIFGGRSMVEYIYYNTISLPQNDKNILFGVNHFYYLFFQLLPQIFGHAFFAIFIASLFYVCIKIARKLLNGKVSDEKATILILLGFILFSASLSPLWVIAANRALVLLPFMVLITGIALSDILKIKKIMIFVTVLLIFVLCLQTIESFAWISLKYAEPSQSTASSWIKNNISKNTVIGIENIPIYQMLPDIIIKEFYEDVYLVKTPHMYNYKVIEAKTPKLPPVIVLSNAQFDYQYRKSSPKKDLYKRMMREGYREVKGFSPNSEYYKYFSNNPNFVTIGLIAYPLRISVFAKQ